MGKDFFINPPTIFSKHFYLLFLFSIYIISGKQEFVKNFFSFPPDFFIGNPFECRMTTQLALTFIPKRNLLSPKHTEITFVDMGEDVRLPYADTHYLLLTIICYYNFRRKSTIIWRLRKILKIILELDVWRLTFPKNLDVNFPK